MPGLTAYQPSAAEPSPPTLSLPTKDEPAQPCDVNRYLAVLSMPFWAASTMIWVHCAPASMEMNTPGDLAGTVVIGSVTVGAPASIVSLMNSTRSLSFGEEATAALKEAS